MTRRWSWTGRVSAILLAVIVGFALIGPWFAEYGITQVIGPPYSGPSAEAPLGTDYLGRDVLSRVLDGGRGVVLTALIATLAGCGLGALIGLAAALSAPRRRWVDSVLMRPLDAVAAMPSLLLLLLLLAALPGRFTTILAVVVTGLPLTARVLRAAASQIIQRSHVEVAVARGERLSWILGRELLPLVSGPLLADAGTRFVQSVYLVVAIGFLGVGAEAADWGLLIVQALPGAQLQPWALATPVLLVAALAVSANLMADDIARRSRGLLA